jgi:hypothetical protein
MSPGTSVLGEGLRPEPFVHIHHGVGHGFLVDPGHGGARHDGDFAGNESVMVHAHGRHRSGAGIICLLRQARRGRQNGEQDSQPQRTQNSCALQPASERVFEFAPKCIGSRTVTGPISLFGLKLSAGGASSHTDRETNQIGSRATMPSCELGARCLSQKTHLRVMKFPISRTFFSLRADSFSRKKVAPAWGEKLGPRRRCTTERLNTIDEIACCGSVFHSAPQLASPQQRLRAGALYSRFWRSSRPH